MTGFQEIGVIATVLLGIFFLPRLMSKRPAAGQVRPKRSFPGKWRLAVALSIVYPSVTGACLYFRKMDSALLLYIGVAPVLLGWLAVWVCAGFRKR